VPRPLPPLSRRRILIGAAALTVLGTAATACSAPPPDPDVEAMTAQLDRARSDSDLATAAATGAPPPVGKVLTTVAAERAAHARAITDELTRMLGTTPTTTTSSTTATSTTTTTAPPKPTTARDVIDALKESATSAGDLAARQSGYRAGLLGSIAASCTAAWMVALGGQDDA
jgi:hypothetical protein